MQGVVFFFATVILTQIARRLGWFLSRNFLYGGPAALVIIACIAWGGATALGVGALVRWLQPHWLLKWIFGYAQGAYAAMPAFGLVADFTVPPQAISRHVTLYYAPLIAYIVALVALTLGHDKLF